ncbi:hypothetical protein [Vibrio anguillarum]|uniref:Uncharacterized protein n=1 Tax=Vibrio anguillarum TaxID=55601 RepID=A0ABR9Z8M7_VIBAN|nr:hypothetical protein [Vibrio anguillarum]MBF4374347.1 hypothetical protein [Vibrio anguillarum]
MDIDNYQEFKASYLKKFSSTILSQWRALEEKEDWPIDTSIHDIAKIFNKLPKVCARPISNENQEILGDLITLIAYLPFVESVIALAWCGFHNEQWGTAIYEISYDIYNEGYEQPIQQVSHTYITARTVVQRVDIVCKIGAIQQVTGTMI